MNIIISRGDKDIGVHLYSVPITYRRSDDEWAEEQDRAKAEGRQPRRQHKTTRDVHLTIDADDVDGAGLAAAELVAARIKRLLLVKK